MNPDSTQRPHKKLKISIPENELPYIILPDGKVECKICPNARSIKKSSWNSHKNGTKHKHLAQSKIDT